MRDDKIDQIIDKHRGKPGSLIHVLMEIQHENHWLPRDVLQRVAEALDVPFSRVMQIATLYKTFSLTPKGRHEVHVCTGMSCHLRGAPKLLDAVQNVTRDQTGRDGRRVEVQPGDRELPRQLQPRAGDHRGRDASRQDDARQGRGRAETISLGEDRAKAPLSC